MGPSVGPMCTGRATGSRAGTSTCDGLPLGPLARGRRLPPGPALRDRGRPRKAGAAEGVRQFPGRGRSTGRVGRRSTRAFGPLDFAQGEAERQGDALEALVRALACQVLRAGPVGLGSGWPVFRPAGPFSGHHEPVQALDHPFARRRQRRSGRPGGLDPPSNRSRGRAPGRAKRPLDPGGPVMARKVRQTQPCSNARPERGRTR